jgi:hypothetical protein
MHREDLLAILDDEDIELPSRLVDGARERIFAMVDKYWTQVESLVSCPLKTRKPRACFGCTDIQVAECSLMNKKLIEGIRED